MGMITNIFPESSPSDQALRARIKNIITAPIIPIVSLLCITTCIRNFRTQTDSSQFCSIIQNRMHPSFS